MTEDEARQKICPMGAGVRATVPGTTLSTGAHIYRTTCIASECMWWRQNVKAVAWRSGLDSSTPEPISWATNPGHGRCGAAGTP